MLLKRINLVLAPVATLLCIGAGVAMGNPLLLANSVLLAGLGYAMDWYLRNS